MKYSPRISVLAPLILFLFFSASFQAHSSYQTLEKKLRQGIHPDTELIESLPSPRTAHQHWLLGRAEEDLEAANRHFIRAIEKGTKETKIKYLKDWLRLALLREPSKVDFDGVNTFFDRSTGKRYMDNEAWYLAGQLAYSLDRPGMADRYFSEVNESSDYHRRAKLLRADVSLKRNRTDQVRKLLREYFLSPLKKDRPLYWLIKGKYFENTGADSEAYIAYSHVINQYPRSLYRFEAEERISDLPLPESLYSSAGSTSEKTAQASASESTETDQNDEDFIIQVGSFRERHRAKQLRQSLNSWVEYPVRIRRVTIDSKRYYRVRVHSIPSRRTAVDLLNEFKDSGYDGFVISPGDQN